MNVKQGDLAIIIYAAPDHLDCLGRIVKVIEWEASISQWVCEFAGARPASMLQYETCCGVDSALRPVSGLDDPEQIDIEQPINNEVTA